MAVAIANEEKSKKELMVSFKTYDREHAMFQQLCLQMMKDQQDTINKQRQKLEK